MLRILLGVVNKRFIIFFFNYYLLEIGIVVNNGRDVVLCDGC